MATLAVTYGKELSQPLTDVYWEALKPLFIEQIESASKSCIRHHKFFPKPADIFQLAKEASAAAPKSLEQLPPPDRKWLAAVNSLFLKYLLRRRTGEGFAGDINLAARRAECLRLAALFDEFEAEGIPEANESELRVRFDLAMVRVPDLGPQPNWMDATREHAQRAMA